MSDETVKDGLVANKTALKVVLPLAPEFRHHAVTLARTETLLEIPLTPGEATTTTPLRSIGTQSHFANPEVMASLTVWSSYAPDHNMLTILSPRMPDLKAPHITTLVPGAEAATTVHHTGYTDPAVAADAARAPHLTAALHDAMRQTLDVVTERIIDAAVAHGINVILRDPPPKLPPEHAEGLKTVYRNGYFLEPYDPEKTYGEDDVVHPIESTYGGLATLTYGQFFSNVIGSTKDPKILPSWTDLWEQKTGMPAVICTSYQFSGFPCTNNLVGGHVILGTTRQVVAPGSNAVLILPICQKHNMNAVYMSALQYTTAVALHNYMQ